MHETAELVLPRLVRRSRLYEATARNLLRITVELVGGVERPPEDIAGEFESSPKKLAVRKGAGNVVELGSILAFGFSPLWLLAGAADMTRGTRVYLDVLVDELKEAGVLAREAELASVDELLAALEGASGTTARLIDIPPLEVEGLKRTLADLRDDAARIAEPRRALRRVLRARPTRPIASRRAFSRSRSAWGLRSSTPPVTSAGSIFSTPTRKTSSPCTTRASARTPAASAARTPRRSHDISTPSAKR